MSEIEKQRPMSNETDKDITFIKALAEILHTSDLSEIEVEREYGEDNELKVRLSRASAVAPVAPAPVQISGPSPTAAPAPVAQRADDAPEANSGPDLTNAVTSPMVGTAYLGPEPGAPNFVTEGDMVEEGQTIMIIEAMKTMNQIPAPRSGRVRAILIENAEPVEFGEPLIVIE